MAGGWTFEEAEKNARAQARHNAAEPRVGGIAVRSSPAVPSGAVPDGVTTSLTMSAASSGAIRVGGNVAPPTKVHVPAVIPAEALRSGGRGVVIIEATIDSDDAVKDARVLRSIPMLDAAAVAAVPQWRYTLTLLNGQAVPVIMTITVAFP
jgi:TonB family protein